MAVSDFFVWGQGGTKKTPDEIAREREMADAILMRAGNTDPVGHWTQGAARVVDALGGVLKERRAAAGEQEIAGVNKNLIASLLSGGSPASVPATSSAIPMTSAAGEVSATAPGSTPAAFEKVAPRLIADLSRDFGITPEQAAGVVGQLGHESAGFGTLQEIKPLVPGSRGGFGYAQWTGPRRKAFEEFAASNSLDPASYEANYGFLANELRNTPEGKVLDSIRSAPDALTAGRTFTDQFLRPGIPGYESRDQWTQRALAFASPEATSTTPEGAIEAVAPLEPAREVATIPVAPAPEQAPVQVAQASGINPAIIEALTNPQATPETQRIAALLLQQEQAKQQAVQEMQLKQADPAYRLGLEKLQLENEALRNPQPKETDEIREYNFARSQGFEGTFADFKQQMRKAGATNVTTNVGEGDKFYENLDKKNAETFAAMSDSGVQARNKMVQIDRLDALLTQSPQGAEAAIKQTLGDLGIPTEGLDSIQATRALLEQMVPQQRPPGSGPMSDADIAMFRNSLPRLINQPGGNQTILQTMRGIAQYEMEMGQIADMVADRAITPTEGRQRIRDLKNPLDDYNKILKQFGTQKQDAGSPPEGIDPADWEFMTPEERKLFQ